MSRQPIAELSPVRPAHSRMKLLFPVQSRGQAVSVAVVFGLIASIGAGVIAFSGVHPGPVLYLTTFAGGLPSLYFSLPGAFEIRARAPVRHWLDDVDEMARFMGYRVQTVEQPGQAWRYRLNHPRWARWAENEIVVRLLDEHRIGIHGPKGALRMLRKHLARRIGATHSAA